MTSLCSRSGRPRIARSSDRAALLVRAARVARVGGTAVRTRRIAIGTVLATAVTVVACSKAPTIPASQAPKALGAAAWVARFCAFGTAVNDEVQQASTALQNASPA